MIVAYEEKMFQNAVDRTFLMMAVTNAIRDPADHVKWEDIFPYMDEFEEPVQEPITFDDAYYETLQAKLEGRIK